MGRSPRYLGFLCAGALVAFAAAQADEPTAPTSTFVEQAEITVDARARGDGFLRARVHLASGTTREATIPVQRRMTENDIAKDLARALAESIGTDYEVRGAGDRLRIRKVKRAAANFSVEISFTAPGFVVASTIETRSLRAPGGDNTASAPHGR